MLQGLVVQYECLILGAANATIDFGQNISSRLIAIWIPKSADSKTLEFGG
jgi:hypothetical protein